MSDSLLGDVLGAYIGLTIADRIVSGRRRRTYRYYRKGKLKRRITEERGLFGF